MALDSMSHIARSIYWFRFAIVLALVPCCLQAQTPTLSTAAAKVGITGQFSGSAPNFEFYMDPSGYPRAVTAGETVFAFGSWPTGNNPTFTDDKNGTSWPAVASCADSTGIMHGFFYRNNAAAGTSVITETHGSNVNNGVIDWAHFYNMSTTASGFVDGSSCRTGQTPSNNTAPNISGTAFTTGTAGDLILTCVYVEGNPLPFPNAISSITFPAGFTGLSEDITLGHACAYGIQTTAGSFTPSFNVAQGTHNTFTIMSAAFKSGSGGSAPATGPAVVLSEMHYEGGTTTGTVNLPCPAGTTAIAVLDDAGALNGVTDSNSNTWSNLRVPGNFYGPIYYVNNPTISSTNTYTVTMSFSSEGNDLDGLMCLSGTNGIDMAATAQNGSTLDASGSAYGTGTVSGGVATDAPAIGTSTPRDLVLAAGAMGTGPVDSCQTGFCVFDYAGSTNWTSGDLGTYNNGDYNAHSYAPMASTVRFNFNIGAGASSTVSGISLAFLPADTSSLAPPSGLTAVVH